MPRLLEVSCQLRVGAFRGMPIGSTVEFASSAPTPTGFACDVAASAGGGGVVMTDANTVPAMSRPTAALRK